MILLVGASSAIDWGRETASGNTVPIIENPTGLLLFGGRVLWAVDHQVDSVVPGHVRGIELVELPHGVREAALGACGTLSEDLCMPDGYPNGPFPPPVLPPGIERAPDIAQGTGDFEYDLHLARLTQEALGETVALVVSSMRIDQLAGCGDLGDDLLTISHVPNMLDAQGQYAGLLANMAIARRATAALVAAVDAAAGGDDSPFAALRDQDSLVVEDLRQLASYLRGGFGPGYWAQMGATLEYWGTSSVSRYLPTEQVLIVGYGPEVKS